MSDKRLDAQITGCTNILSVSISEAHSASTAVALIQCVETTLDIGDFITVNLGYSDNKPKIFEGYVKKIERKTPENTFSITANDVMSRAIDFFIVGANAESPYTFRNITAEDLIAEVLGMAGLSSFDFDTTYFTFGINNDVEVNLISSYDYARQITDIIAWEFWADHNGTIHLANRKPYPMDGTSGQPGDNPDSSVLTITDATSMEITKTINEKELRNKIVIYGKDSLSATASSATSYDPVTGTSRQILPAGFYKAAVLASPLIEQQGFAQDAADYNLDLYNRLMYEIPISIEGNPDLHARSCVTLNSTSQSLNNEMFYIQQLDHSWTKGGYITNLVLRK